MYSNVIPGNYFISKSMEWQRLKKKINEENIKLGNYWFIKKFIIYYYFIFSKKIDIESDDFYTQISIKFKEFIESLPVDMQADAEKYFFEIDIRDSNKIFKWTDFYDVKEQPSTSKEIYKYRNMAKKIYFIYLMQIGGQSGDKKRLRTIDMPNRVPYHILKSKHTSEVISDVHSTLRNNRQMFYYYGFMYMFESKKVEEYSLTQIGLLLLNANWNELSIVMEHQKIKMISQPPNISINGVANEGYNTDFFEIEVNPYLKILKYIQKYGYIDRLHFQYVVSRNVPLDTNFELMKEQILGISRAGDNNTEDFSKELKKYLYGLSESSNDKIDFLRYYSSNTTYKLIDHAKIKNYINIIDGYKQKKDQLFETSKVKYEKILKRFYSEKKINIKYEDIYKWYSYISMPDDSLLVTLLLFFETNDLNFMQIKKSYPTLFKHLQVKSKDWLEFKNVQNSNNDLKVLYGLIYNKLNKDISEIDTEELGEEIFKIHHVNDLVKKSDEFFDDLESKKRKHIIYIKSYYEHMDVKRCDCCGETSFIKNNGKKYFEYHHLIPISESGPDHILNIFGICANCHRKFHFENDIERLENYKNIDKNNFLALQNYENSSVLNRMKYLFNNGKVDLLALEFLVKEKFLKKEDIEDFILRSNRVGE